MWFICGYPFLYDLSGLALYLQRSARKFFLVRDIHFRDLDLCRFILILCCEFQDCIVLIRILCIKIITHFLTTRITLRCFCLSRIKEAVRITDQSYAIDDISSESRIYIFILDSLDWHDTIFRSKIIRQVCSKCGSTIFTGYHRFDHFSGFYDHIAVIVVHVSVCI